MRFTVRYLAVLILVVVPTSHARAVACAAAVALGASADVTADDSGEILLGPGRSFRPAGPVDALALSTDGTQLAVGSGRTLRLYETATGVGIGVAREFSEGITAVAFSPDGRRIAVATRNFRITTVALSGETARLSLEVLPLVGAYEPLRRQASCLAFSSDGTRLAGGFPDGSFRVFDLREGRQVLAQLHETDRIIAIAFRKQDRTLVTFNEIGSVMHFDIRDPQMRVPFAPSFIPLWNLSTLERLRAFRELLRRPSPPAIPWRTYEAIRYRHYEGPSLGWHSIPAAMRDRCERSYGACLAAATDVTAVRRCVDEHHRCVQQAISQPQP